MIKPAPINDITLTSLQRFSSSWVLWFQSLQRILSGSGGPFPLASYLVATMPDPSVYQGSLIYVSNATGGSIPAFSDGLNWRRADTRAIVT